MAFHIETRANRRMSEGQRHTLENADMPPPDRSRPQATSLAIIAALMAASCAAPAAPSGADAPAGALASGQPPGEAFHFDLTQPFDARTQYRSDYALSGEWHGSAFDPGLVVFTPDGVELTLLNRPRGRSPTSGAEFQIRGFYGYGRYEVVMKGGEGEGMVSSFFTHTGSFARWINDPHDEIDFEFLGKNTRQAHLNYFRNGKPAGGVYVNLAFDYTQDFHLYAFEWTPGEIRWFIDNQLVHAVRDAAGVPSAPGRVIMNIWASSGSTTGWLGPRNFGASARAVYRCVSHVPIGGAGPQCSDAFVVPVPLRGTVE
jgi:hypothetical protein